MFAMTPKYISFLVLSCLLLNACSPGESRVEEGNRLGIYHLGNGSDPQSIDPHVATGVTESRILNALYEGLVNTNPYSLEQEPGVAERWEISDDGLRYRFYLRDNAKWSNGDPVTAEDFHWSFWRHLNPKMGNQWTYMLFPVLNAEAFATGEIDDFGQVGFRVIDRLTFEIELEKPTPYFIQLVAHSSSHPVHRATVEKHGGATARFSPWTRAENIVTNGPFVLKEWKVNKPVVVEKNPLYWDKDRVALNGIHYHPTENKTTEEKLFRADQLHSIYELTFNKIPFYRENNPEVLRVVPYIGTYYYQINTTRKPFDDVRVRRALAMTIDREALVKTVMNGVNIPAYSMVPPGTLGYQPPRVFGYDPETARQLLAEAGYPEGEGFPTFDILYNTHESHRKVAVAIQQMWKKQLNIDVTITNQEWKVYLDSRNTKNYDVSRAGWIGDYVHPLTFLTMGLSTNGNNNTGYADKHYDELIKRITDARTEEEQLASFEAAERYLLKDMPYIPIYTYQTKYLVDEGVRGLPANIRDHYNFRYVSVGNGPRASADSSRREAE